MRVFVYEAMTAGAGWARSTDSAPGEGLFAEGLAMLRAVTEDFAALEGVEVWGLRDARFADYELPRQEAVVRSAAEEREEFQKLANFCDWALLIAPELDGMLEERVGWLQGMNSALLSPSAEFVKIASSKRSTAERLRERGLPVPVGVPPSGGVLKSPEGGTPAGELEFPLVLKRDDGAGSLGMRLIQSREELEAAGCSILITANYHLERYCPGLPASVAILCGPAGNVSLQPCAQILNPTTLEYLGGRTPLPRELEDRAKSLALAAISAMPPTAGYVGVDLVLGEQANGSQDVVIEINPRLTTSYVGLRQACHQNLAWGMLEVAGGRLVDLSYRKERVEFRV
jgi:tyramine---L-glutamate ligase